MMCCAGLDRVTLTPAARVTIEREGALSLRIGLRSCVTVGVFALLSISFARADDLSGRVKKAIEQSTLDQAGTKPFHLKASFTPSLERDKASNRVGDIEIWWQSPQHWRREVRSPEFHQVEIVDGARDWQKNDGDYFPEWLRELAQAMVQPIPLPMDQLLNRVKTAEVRNLAGQTNVDWDAIARAGSEQANGKGYVALNINTGLILYTGGPGWDGSFHDFKDFHGRKIAWTVASGNMEVTAKVSVLEDLGSTPAGFFDANASGGDQHPIATVALSESELRSSLISSDPIEWPALADGPLEGVVWTEVAIDRTGHIREMIPPIADNGGVKDAADRAFRSMQFRPVLRDGVAVQATGRLSMPFKTMRPPGVETLESARTYFEKGRKATYLAYGGSTPYVLRMEFQVGSSSGVQTGRYEDTWLGPTEWKREAWLGSSHVARSRNGEQYYRLADGSDARLLQMVLNLIEPIPASDTMTESDWRIRRDTVDGVKAIRVIRGAETADGKPAPDSEAFWFAESGRLIKSYSGGLETVPNASDVYGGMDIARIILVSKDGKLGMRISVKEIVAPQPDAAKNLKLKGHEWQRAFTADER
jgi:hypothetical protein